MSKKRLVDPACRTLAEHFYPTATNAQICDLARDLEDVAVEFSRGIRQLPGRTPPLNGADDSPAALLERLAHRIRLAEIAYAKALVALYPVGTKTAYRMNGVRDVACTVIGHREDRIKVRGRSGAEYFVRPDQMAAEQPVATAQPLAAAQPVAAARPDAIDQPDASAQRD